MSIWIAQLQSLKVKTEKMLTSCKSEVYKSIQGSTLEGKKMILWQVAEKVRIYRGCKFEVDLKPTVREFKELWRKRNTGSNDGAA